VRSFQLIRLAIEAEALRLRYRARRTANRLVFALLAALLLLGAVMFGHVAAWYWLREHLPGQYVALIFAGVDLLFAAILATLASHSAPGHLEVEALEVRRRALDDAAGSLSVMAMAIRAVELLMSSRKRK
jgi:fatty acid desaturase